MRQQALNEIIKNAQRKAMEDNTTSLWEETKYIKRYLFEAGYLLDTSKPHPFRGYIATAMDSDGTCTVLGRYEIDQYGYDVLYLD